MEPSPPRSPSGACGLRAPEVASLPTPWGRPYAVDVRRSEAIAFFSAHREELRRLGISSLLVFGSVARDEARPDSDLDLIAEFDRPIGYLGLARVQRELEGLRGAPWSGIDSALRRT